MADVKAVGESNQSNEDNDIKKA